MNLSQPAPALAIPVFPQTAAEGEVPCLAEGDSVKRSFTTPYSRLPRIDEELWAGVNRVSGRYSNQPGREFQCGPLHICICDSGIAAGELRCNVHLLYGGMIVDEPCG